MDYNLDNGILGIIVSLIIMAILLYVSYCLLMAIGASFQFKGNKIKKKDDEDLDYLEGVQTDVLDDSES